MLIHRNSSVRAPSRVVVLGAHGFVATALSGKLRQDGVAYLPVGRAVVDLIASDAVGKLRTLLQRQDAIVVTSALTPEHGRDQASFHSNVAMIDNLCTYLAERSCAHIVYLSSDSVYDFRATLINEETCCQSSDLYALAHIVRENLLAQVCRSSNIPLAIVRPCAIYGAGDPHNSYGPNRFVRTAQSIGKITLFGNGEEERDHVYIDDVVEIVLQCLLRGSTGVINAVSGTALSFHEVAGRIIAAIGRPVGIETVPRRVPIIHKRFDATALLRAFPEFVTTSLETGIRHVLADLSCVDKRVASPGGAQSLERGIDYGTQK